MLKGQVARDDTRCVDRGRTIESVHDTGSAACHDTRRVNRARTMESGRDAGQWS